jgi:RHS repeat-associated protein
LTDFAGAIVELYAFDAYGNAIGFDPSVALTEFLYSGEQFDSKIGQQYLRARYYDPATGRFNRLDPFFGNVADPQSLHNYLYAHNDPINGYDPTGESFAISISISIGIGAGIGATVGYLRHGAEGALFGAIGGGLGGAAAFLTLPLLLQILPATSFGAFAATTGSVAIAASLEGLVYGTFVDDNGIQFDPLNGLWEAGKAGVIGIISGGVLGVGMKFFAPIRTFVSKMIQDGHIFGKSINPAYNTFVEYLRRASNKTCQAMKKAQSLVDRNLKPDKYISFGDLFDIPQKDMGKRFLYNIDESGFCTIANDIGDDITKPFRTSHTLLGNTSRSAGEVIFDGSAVVLNTSSGHGVRNLELAVDYFESIGYKVVKTFDGPTSLPNYWRWPFNPTN